MVCLDDLLDPVAGLGVLAFLITGNLTILGAASNFIILEVLEVRYGRTISFVEFLKTGQ